MGYERNPRNSPGGYDDRDQRQTYGRDPYGSGRDGNEYRGENWGGGDDYGRRGQSAYGYGDRDEGNRAARYRRDAGLRGQGQGYGDPSHSGYGEASYGQSGYSPRDYGRPEPSGDRDRGQQGSGRQPQRNDRDDRGFFDRAGDEVRSWFGDDEASRRREQDARYDEPRYANPHDEHYGSWRRSQIEALDRDYHEYRQENRSKFESEFGSWRNQRQTQRGLLSKVEEHFEVVGSDGAHVGTVDKVRGDRIILTRNDQDAGGRHHSIPSRWIQSVDDKVTIGKTADDAKAHWRDEERNQAFFNEDGSHKDDANARGPHVLGKSFSGTY